VKKKATSGADNKAIFQWGSGRRDKEDDAAHLAAFQKQCGRAMHHIRAFTKKTCGIKLFPFPS